jgi:hypothetical protein
MALAATLAAASSIASGYYNWVYFAGGSAPFTPVPARFDLNALPNSTVSYFISDQTPSPLMPGDSFQAIVSQIRAAADVWNQVPTSVLRVAFGGISTIGATQQSTPGIDVVFDDNMPPGLLAQTRITVPADLSFVANAPFVPIQRSRVQLRHDLTANSQFSGADAFFMTVAHEFGHALGLQHTLTSGVMSTAVTRATTKAAPLAADDVAGVSLLYPASGFLSATGSISGTVTLGGTGINLASVVAISTNGVAISSLTNPDGTYRIRGIPPGQYYVYTHPLPPPLNGEASPANVIPPVDTHLNPFPAFTGFDTEFFPGTKDWTQAATVFVGAGSNSGGVNFNMQPRSSTAIPYLLTYGYQGKVAVPSPPIPGGSSAAIVFYAPGTTANGSLASGLNISAVGGLVHVHPGSLQYYSGTSGYAYFLLDSAAVPSATPVAVAVTLPNDLYVLPAAFSLVPNAPPSINSVLTTGVTSPQGTPVVNITGANLRSTSKVMFDGAAGTILSSNGDGSLMVSAPPVNGPYVANVETLTLDGQTSQQGLGSSPIPTIAYSGPANPSISVTPANLFPGTDALVEIDGIGTSFSPGSVTVGFGSSDIAVKQLWPLGLGRLAMNISVSQQAQPGSVQMSLAFGLELITLNSVVQVQTGSPTQMSLVAPVLNQATGLAGTPAGGVAVVATTGIPATITGGWTLTVGGQAASILSVAGGQLYFSVPNGLQTGPVPVQLTSPNGNAIPAILMQIDQPPPVILGAANAAGVSIDQTHTVKPGDTVVLTVSGLLDSSGNPPAASNLLITVGSVNGFGGMGQTPFAVFPSSIPGAVQIPFVLNPNVPTGPNESLTIALGTRVSAPTFTIPIRQQ